MKKEIYDESSKRMDERRDVAVDSDRGAGGGPFGRRD